MYKCVVDFELECFDEDGRSCDAIMIVEVGSIWEVDLGDKLIDGENRLINNTTNQWIEISDEVLEGYFVKLKQE
jgi:hypothetical protein